jgi:hypothetical protein
MSLPMARIAFSAVAPSPISVAPFAGAAAALPNCRISRMKAAGPTRGERISRSQPRHPASDHDRASFGILADRGAGGSVTGCFLTKRGAENG